METTRYGGCATVTEVDPSNNQATVALLGGEYELYMSEIPLNPA